MKRQTKLTPQEQEQLAAAQQRTQSSSPQEFASVEEMLRHDALHTPVPPNIAPADTVTALPLKVLFTSKVPALT